jgi:exopolysaccharide production protein ExoQ
MTALPRQRQAVAAQTSQVRRIETALVFVWLLLATGAFRTLLSSGAGDRETGSILFQLATLSVVSAAAILLLRGVPVWFPSLVRASWPILALTGLALISTVWSDSPSTTFRRAIALWLTTGFAFFVVARFEVRQFIKILAAAFVLLFLASFLAAAIPGLGITPSGLHEGAWRGLAGQKNEFGRTCGLALTFFVIAGIISRPGTKGRYWLGACLALILLLLSMSKTPISAAAVGLGGTLISVLVLHGRIGRVQIAAGLRVILLAIIVTVILVSTFWVVPLIVQAMGRDLTFSGRTELWKWAISIGSNTPWFGSGYRGFWNDANTKYFFEFFAWKRTLDGELSDSFSGPTHAHSGYIDLWLELGWIGVLVFVGVICIAFAKISYCFRAGRNDVAICFSAVTFFLLAYAFTAKSIMQQTEDLWFLFVVFHLYSARVQVEGLGRITQGWDESFDVPPSHADGWSGLS